MSVSLTDQEFARVAGPPAIVNPDDMTARDRRAALYLAQKAEEEAREYEATSFGGFLGAMVVICIIAIAIGLLEGTFGGFHR